MINTIARNEAEFCGKVPLHQTNLLQPYGYLLILDSSLNILQGGENVNELLGSTVQSLVNTNIQDHIEKSSIEKLKEAIENPGPEKKSLQLNFHSASHLAFIIRKPGYFILEIEKQPVQQENIFLHRIYQEIKELLDGIESAAAIEKFCQAALVELKRISGFDKIMIYRFDENWNGDVIAEVLEGGMDSYLGLKFPSSDVPRQARELYKTTPYRLIPDIKYEPVKLYPVINRITGGFTDLSSSNLRSVAAVHIEYLSNMKVQASMSTRILVDGKLWGLVACHHRTAKVPDYNSCSFFEIFSQLLSARISWIQEKEAFEQNQLLNNLQLVIIANFLEAGSFIEGIRNSKNELLQLFSAGGLSFILDRQVYSFGNVPKKKDIEDILVWIHANNIESLYHQSCMSSVFEPALDYSAIASGLLVLPLHKTKDDFILAFRPEAGAGASWGGNPEEAVQFEAGGRKYHPRSSFAQWQQTVEHTATPWGSQELEAAEKLLNFIRPLLYPKTLLINN